MKMVKNLRPPPPGPGASFGSDAIHLCYARRSDDGSALRLDLLVRCIGLSRHPQTDGEEQKAFCGR